MLRPIGYKMMQPNKIIICTFSKVQHKYSYRVLRNITRMITNRRTKGVKREI